MAEITSITRFLMDRGLINDQTFPRRRIISGHTIVDYPTILPGATLLRNEPYPEVYRAQLNERSFNFLMLDGALVQMTYKFHGNRLVSGRLAFLPSPDLSEYQNDPEVYSLDTMFAEVVDRRVVTVPMRFDFDSDEKVVAEVHHPKSHLTLGQYANCRIAATAAITPGAFIEFVLRSFYNTASRQHSTELPIAVHRFEPTISATESRLVHIGIPA